MPLGFPLPLLLATFHTHICHPSHSQPIPLLPTLLLATLHPHISRLSPLHPASFLQHFIPISASQANPLTPSLPQLFPTYSLDTHPPLVVLPGVRLNQNSEIKFALAMLRFFTGEQKFNTLISTFRAPIASHGKWSRWKCQQKNAKGSTRMYLGRTMSSQSEFQRLI